VDIVRTLHALVRQLVCAAGKGHRQQLADELDGVASSGGGFELTIPILRLNTQPDYWQALSKKYGPQRCGRSMEADTAQHVGIAKESGGRDFTPRCKERLIFFYPPGGPKKINPRRFIVGEMGGEAGRQTELKHGV